MKFPSRDFGVGSAGRGGWLAPATPSRDRWHLSVAPLGAWGCGAGGPGAAPSEPALCYWLSPLAGLRRGEGTAPGGMGGRWPGGGILGGVMSKKSQVCVACGVEKGKDAFERFDGGKVWSPVCMGCTAEQERVREKAERERAKRAAAVAEEQRRERLAALRAEREAARIAAADAEVDRAVDKDRAGEEPASEEPVAVEREGREADLAAAVKRLEGEIAALNERLGKWELFHHPVRTIALGIVAWSVIAGIIAAVTFVACAMVASGLAMQGGGMTAQNIGLAMDIVGLSVLVVLSIWMVRLLRR